MNLFKFVRRFAKLLLQIDTRLLRLEKAIGRIELRQSMSLESSNLNDHEFQVFSEWGEDGIIQYLVRNIDIENNVFVEFGVEDYSESNTRFLLENNNWSGLVIDSSQANVDCIKNESMYWRCNLKAACEFVDIENINRIIERNGLTGDIGLLSIDIDGNDYWLWNAINCISPRIVICEYNSLFGPRAKVTIPYNEKFNRTVAHYSNLYMGASIAALTSLAREKGYSLVCSNSAGSNAFFVRNDVVGDLPICEPESAYVESKFREARDEAGNLTFVCGDERLSLIGDLPIFDLDTQKTVKIKELKI
ncbi:MAG: hypothetical protein C0623_00760 [Desulfuromonas sp.]|nr:MAG: hypothetical protein C0623_00760 [Desulfuromonas sp.]